MVVDSDGEVLFSNMCGRHDVRLCVEQLVSSEQICIVAMIPAYATQAFSAQVSKLASFPR